LEIEKIFDREAKLEIDFSKNIKKYIFNLRNKYYLSFHGTSTSRAESIFHTGLSLGSVFGGPKMFGATATAIKIKSMKDLIQQLFSYSHQWSNAVVVIAFNKNELAQKEKEVILKPNRPKDYMINIRMGFVKWPHDIVSLPFIVGYLDTARKIFKINPAFKFKGQKPFLPEPD
jgi:hypothetical protein